MASKKKSVQSKPRTASSKDRERSAITGQSKESAMDAVTRRYKTDKAGPAVGRRPIGKSYETTYVTDKLTGGNKAYSRITDTTSGRPVVKNTGTPYKSYNTKTAANLKRRNQAAGKAKNLNSKMGGRTK